VSENQIVATLVDHMGTDDSIATAARVSFNKTAGNYTKEQNNKLLSYLAKHKHMSPFGHVFLSFHVKAPIFVARQLVKHKFLRWNEISRRYVDDDPEFYVPDVWRGKSADKKQGSEGVVELGFFSTEGGRFEGYFGEGTLAEAVSEYAQDLTGLYEALILVGVAPEQARMVLPQSTMTEWYWSGSLDAFTDMCSLRLKEDTQYESRLVAEQVYRQMKDVFPVAAPLLVEGVL